MASSPKEGSGGVHHSRSSYAGREPAAVIVTCCRRSPAGKRGLGELLEPGAMERKGHRGGGRRAPGDQDGACEGEPGAVVQRTQVLLLAGEPWGPDGGQSVLSSFAHHVLPPTGDSSSSSSHQSPSAAASGESSAEPQPVHLPAAPSGQLIFFLCRPSSLRERQERLREVLHGVREQSRSAPAALVGVIVQPRPEEEAEARQRLEELLRDIFQAESAAPIEVHTAVFAPGRPEGALELHRVKNRADSRAGAAGSQWMDKLLTMQVLGAVLSFSTVAFGGYYFYNNPVV